jgi:hypothetical protein
MFMEVDGTCSRPVFFPHRMLSSTGPGSITERSVIPLAVMPAHI